MKSRLGSSRRNTGSPFMAASLRCLTMLAVSKKKNRKIALIIARLVVIQQIKFHHTGQKYLFGTVVYCAHTSSSSFLSISFRSLPNSVFRVRYKLSSRGAYFSTAALNVPSKSLFVIRKKTPHKSVNCRKKQICTEE